MWGKKQEIFNQVLKIFATIPKDKDENEEDRYLLGCEHKANQSTSSSSENITVSLMKSPQSSSDDYSFETTTSRESSFEATACRETSVENTRTSRQSSTEATSRASSFMKTVGVKVMKMDNWIAVNEEKVLERIRSQTFMEPKGYLPISTNMMSKARE